MVIIWWVLFCVWAILIPYALVCARLFSSGQSPNKFITLIHPVHFIIGIFIGLSTAFIHQIEWWWSIIFTAIMWVSVTLSAGFSAIIVWIILLVLSYTSGIIG